MRFDLYAPMRCKGKGRFSDTDIVRYGKIEKFSDAEWEMKSTYSPKEIIFPVTQKLFSIDTQKLNTPVEKLSKTALVFLRPCDINGISRLDQIFLKNGNELDYYYARLREKIHFALIECVEGYENWILYLLERTMRDQASDFEFVQSGEGKIFEGTVLRLLLGVN